ncbi:MAG TPA: amidohydrolase family protein [Bdellovibrionales bacterium]|nr:amidohydrolase family protein [Bdellovibrionales bacterium]
MSRILFNCYDSHVHWQATGEHTERLTLKHLKSAEDLAQLAPQPHHYRGDWLTGWGWDQNQWTPPEFPTAAQLDRFFPDSPVAFTRADGHAMWINSEALRRIPVEQLVGFSRDGQGGRVVRDESGSPTGILIDNAMSMVRALIPPPPAALVRRWLKTGMQVFNSNGFTHIRDLSCDWTQWREARALEESGELTLAVEQYFDADPFEHFDRALEWADRARQENSRLLRVAGIKVYYDGALGSEGALLSHPYRSGEAGLRLMTPQQVREAATRAWQAGFDLAVHVIGDLAAHEVVSTAVDLWQQGLKGRLHLEHAELLRPETAELLKGRNVVCHIQPCHWLTDREWLQEKIGGLAKFAFPWALLQRYGIPFDFGSDSPIEPPHLRLTRASVDDSANAGVDKLAGDPFDYHQHPDRDWTPGTQTRLDGDQVSRVTFMGRDLIF